MLVIRCRAGQSILIGDGVELEILEAGQNKVKLGITAPRDLPIIRKELEMTRQENVAAAAADPAYLLDLLRKDQSAR